MIVLNEIILRLVSTYKVSNFLTSHKSTCFIPKLSGAEISLVYICFLEKKLYTFVLFFIGTIIKTNN